MWWTLKMPLILLCHRPAKKSVAVPLILDLEVHLIHEPHLNLKLEVWLHRCAFSCYSPIARCYHFGSVNLHSNATRRVF